jgi:hypothetical protein
MSNFNGLLQKLLDANDTLAGWHQAVDREWNILQRYHIERTGNPIASNIYGPQMYTSARLFSLLTISGVNGRYIQSRNVSIHCFGIFQNKAVF